MILRVRENTVNYLATRTTVNFSPTGFMCQSVNQSVSQSVSQAASQLFHRIFVTVVGLQVKDL